MISVGQVMVEIRLVKSNCFMEFPKTKVSFLLNAMFLKTDCGRNRKMAVWMASAALGTLWGVPIKTNDFILSGNSKAYSRANIPPIEIPHKWIWPWVLLQYPANEEYRFW